MKMREWQTTAMNKTRNESGIIIASTGSGKTWVALGLIKEKPTEKWLIIVPTIVLMEQWNKQLEELGINTSRIGGGYHELPGPGATIAIINSLQKINLSHPRAKFDHAIYDECHRYASENSLQVIKNLNCKHHIGLTATLERPDGSEKYLLSLIGPIKYSMTLNDEESKKYVSEFSVNTIPITLPKEELEQYQIENTTFLRALQAEGYDLMKLFKNARKYRKGLESMKNRRNIIQDTPLKREVVLKLIKENPEEKILIFDENKENAKKIYDMLIDEGYKTGLYYSGIPKKTQEQTIKDYKQGKTNILVTVRALDEGMDVPSITMAIIVNGNNTKRQFYQRLGRIIRKEEGKKAKLIMLYCKNTHEVKTIEKRLGYL